MTVTTASPYTVRGHRRPRLAGGAARAPPPGCTSGREPTAAVPRDRPDRTVRAGRPGRGRRCRSGPRSRAGCAPRSRTTSAGSGEMMAALQRLFGPYPFREYVVVVADDDLDDPIEAQGMSVFGAQPRRRAAHPRAAGRARAGPPVVRQQPDGRRLAAHLAQRGLRHVRRVAVVRASPAARRRTPTPAQWHARLAAPPGGPASSRTRASTGCSTRGLQARRADAARPAHEDRRRGVLRAAARRGSPSTGTAR